MPKKVNIEDLIGLAKANMNVENDESEQTAQDVEFLASIIEDGLKCPETRDLALEVGRLIIDEQTIRDKIDFLTSSIATILDSIEDENDLGEEI